jgi:hypothetical protein
LNGFGFILAAMLHSLADGVEAQPITRVRNYLESLRSAGAPGASSGRTGAAQLAKAAAERMSSPMQSHGHIVRRGSERSGNLGGVLVLDVRASENVCVSVWQLLQCRNSAITGELVRECGLGRFGHHRVAPPVSRMEVSKYAPQHAVEPRHRALGIA